MADLDAEQRARVEDVLELVTQIASGDFGARREISPRRDEIDALVIALNLVAEDFGIERARRHKAEEELRDRIEAYESAPAMFCSVDAASGRIVDCNRTMEAALGRPRAVLVGSGLESLYVPEAAEHARASLRALRLGEPLPPGDHDLRTGDDRHLPTLLSGSAVRDASGAPKRLRLIYRDVSAERRLEGQLLQAQKMEEIGRLAGGVAHDFNNLLTAIVVSAEALSPHVAPAGAEDVQEVLGAARRAAELVSQLLAFSRRTVVAPRAIDPNERLRAMDKLLARTLGERVAVVTELEPAVWTVMIDPARFDQVLVNLAVNARDAMPDGGRLVLRTRNVTLGETEVRALAGLRPGDHVEIAVIDQGVGMGREVLDHLFEPFFTTKAVGKGTGLGLATVWGIVRQAGGTIAVQSAPGTGTTFRIYLPRVHVSAERDAIEPAVVAEGGHETVLVVEDDVMVRRVVVRTLSKSGYQVIEVPDGAAALELLRARGPVDLVVSDVVMPRLGGRELATQLRQASLCRAVLLVSGYTGEALTGQALEEGVRFLPKPFTPTTLLRAVRGLLDQG